MGQVALANVAGYPHHIARRGNRTQQAFFGGAGTKWPANPK
jgi:hypothetical protein